MVVQLQDAVDPGLKCMQTPACALVPEVSPSSMNDNRGPRLVYYTVGGGDMDVANTGWWGLDTKWSVADDELTVVG